MDPWDPHLMFVRVFKTKRSLFRFQISPSEKGHFALVVWHNFPIICSKLYSVTFYISVHRSLWTLQQGLFNSKKDKKDLKHNKNTPIDKNPSLPTSYDTSVLWTDWNFHYNRVTKANYHRANNVHNIQCQVYWTRLGSKLEKRCVYVLCVYCMWL